MRLIFLFLCFTYINCNEPVPTAIRPPLDGRIVGGEDVNITAVPYQVSVQISGSHECGGTIIGSNVILTAAHCIHEAEKDNYNIRAGSSYIDRDGEVYTVKEIVKHDSFQPGSIKGDIAILWLSKSLEFSDKVATITMKASDAVIPDGDLMQMTGWGRTSEAGPYAEMLQKVLLPKISEADCKKVYPGITEFMLCAGYTDGGKDACQGDSGGPLVHDEKLAGVASFGHGCARPKYPGVYTNVAAMRSWIDATVEKGPSKD